MVKGSAVVRNGAGIHVRPSGVIFNAAREYDCKILVRAGGDEVRLNNVMNLIALGLRQGDELEVLVDGSEEKKVLEELLELFERRYDFPPRT